MESINLDGYLDITVAQEAGMLKRLNNGHIIVDVKIYANRDGENAYGKTHYATCAPKKADRKDGVKYTCGYFATMKPFEAQAIAADEDIFGNVDNTFSPHDDFPI